MTTTLAAASPENASLPKANAGTDPTRRIFWMFAVGHLVIWILLPLLTHPNAPLDTVEMVYWGHEWQLGYYKHPPLPAWTAEAMTVLGGGSVWAIYVVGQLAVVACFWAAWRLAREMVSPAMALLAACLLECCYYYNFKTTDFNNNVAMYPFWALAVLFFYWALDSGKNRYWLATGLSLGLGLLAKYSVAMLVLPMLVFMVWEPKARSSWLRPGPYLTAVVASLVFAPHLYWAIANRFPTIEYCLARTSSQSHLFGHVLNPLDFAAAQLWALLPLVFVAIPLTGYRWRLRKIEPRERFNRNFLLAMALGPFLLHLLISGLFNIRLRSMYGSQLWTFAGLLVLFFLETKPGAAGYQKVLTGCVVMALVFATATATHDVAGPYIRGKGSRVHFPGKTLAKEVDNLWGQRCNESLPIVAGQLWPAANVGLYGSSRPSVFGSDNPNEPVISRRYCPWASDGEFKRRGGVVLWDTSCEELDMPAELRQHFPNAEILDPLVLPWQTRASVPPVRIGVAIVPSGLKKGIERSHSEVSLRIRRHDAR